jgi:hypothetical protein
VQKGLDATGALWPDVEQAYAWVQRAHSLLENAAGQRAEAVRADYDELLADILQAGSHGSVFLSEAAYQFVKVSQSYGSGLFCCYEQPDLPRTNNDSEHYFGSWRYHERRTTGRKTAAASLVVRGSVRMVAAVATRQRPVCAEPLRPPSVRAWRLLRAQLEQRQETRRQQRRFRRDPDAYLQAVEQRLLKTFLPV